MSRLSEAEKLLKECLYCFNEIPNKSIKHSEIKSTYKLAAKIDKYFKDKPDKEQCTPSNK